MRCHAKARCELHNHYGPSETHVCSWAALDGEAATWTRRFGPLPPIGRPIGNARLYVVEPATLQLQPLGVPGELLAGGACVAEIGRAHV